MRRRASARSRTAGCTRATSGSIDEDGYLSITGRKKDIIITAGGKNLTPANIENDLKQCRWISQAVMHGDQRPYPVVLITLDEEEMPVFAARARAAPRTSPRSSREPAVQALIQEEIDRANAKYAQVEQVKKFAILDHDLSQATGELTPTLKVKRNVVNEKYADAVRRALRRLTWRRRHSCEHGRRCAPTQRTTAACSSGAGPARRPSTSARCPSAAASCASASTARWPASCSRR